MAYSNTLGPPRLAALALVAVAAGLVIHVGACGGGGASVCGNGAKEAGEDCDNGALNGTGKNNCSVECRSVSVSIPQLQVKWGILKRTGVPNYGGAGCLDVNAETAKVELAGPSPQTLMLPCRDYSRLYSKDLAAGQYSVTVTLLDKSGAAVTKPVTTGPVDAQPGPVVDLVVDFGMDSFITPYTGSYRVYLSWGDTGVRCAAASVGQQAFTLIPDGKMTPVMATTIPGTKLDGTRAACYSYTTMVSEEAENLDWGAYTLLIQGYANAQAMAPSHCGRFRVFIGPGSRNMVWNLTVAKTGSVDAGAPCP